MRCVWLGATALLVGCGAGSDLAPTRIVLITIDTLRDDSLALMPETRAFAAGGLHFEEAHAATATTQPTHASLFTGRHPWEHGVTRNGLILAQSQDTLAERLKRLGFETSGVAASVPMQGRFGFSQGFDRYADEFDQLYARKWENKEVAEGKFYSLAERITSQALEQLRVAEGELQFFWFHYFDPHDPYGDHQEDKKKWVGIQHLLAAASAGSPDAPELVRHAKKLYEEDVRALDHELVPLFAELKAGMDAYDTHVFFTSDHGESFGEKGCLGHGKRLVPEQIEVPFFYVGSRTSEQTQDPCGSVDVATTILRLAGGTSAMSGRDLFAPAKGRPVAVGMRRTFEGEKFELLLDGTRLPIQGERFYFAGERYITGDAETLYAADDFERPFSDSEHQGIRRFFQTIQKLLEGVSSEELTDEDVRAALRALGYTD